MNTEQAILSNINDPHLKAIINIELTNGWQCHLQDKFFREYQLSHQQYNILRILRGQYPKGVSVNEIKRRMIDKMSNVSRLVEKLKLKALVERIECQKDRRVCYVTMTEAGAKILKEIDKKIPAVIDTFRNITEDEASELVRILEKMRSCEKCEE